MKNLGISFCSRIDKDCHETVKHLKVTHTVGKIISVGNYLPLEILLSTGESEYIPLDPTEFLLDDGSDKEWRKFYIKKKGVGEKPDIVLYPKGNTTVY